MTGFLSFGPSRKALNGHNNRITNRYNIPLWDWGPDFSVAWSGLTFTMCPLVAIPASAHNGNPTFQEMRLVV